MLALTLLLAAAPANVVLSTSGSPTAGTGACSPLVTIEVQDSQGTPVSPGTNATAVLSLKVNGADAPILGAFFPDSAQGCSDTPIDRAAGIVFPAGSAKVSFHFIVPDTGTATIGATVGQLPPATQTWTVNAAPGEPTTVQLLGVPASLDEGICSPALTLHLVDVNGSAASVDRSISMTLDPAEYLEMYSQAGCTGRIQSVDVRQGDPPDKTVFIKPSLSGSFALVAGAPGLHSSTVKVPVNAASGGGCSSAPADLLTLLPALFLWRRRRA